MCIYLQTEPFRLLGLISAVLMNRMMVLTFTDTTDVPRLWLPSEPCQSAQTSMLVSVRTMAKAAWLIL